VKFTFGIFLVLALHSFSFAGKNPEFPAPIQGPSECRIKAIVIQPDTNFFNVKIKIIEILGYGQGFSAQLSGDSSMDVSFSMSTKEKMSLLKSGLYIRANMKQLPDSFSDKGYRFFISDFDLVK